MEIFLKIKSKGRYIFPSTPSKRYIYVRTARPVMNTKPGAAKLNIAFVGRECGNFADATGIRLGRRNSTAHKWMRTVALFCGVRKVRLLCEHSVSRSHRKLSLCHSGKLETALPRAVTLQSGLYKGSTSCSSVC